MFLEQLPQEKISLPTSHITGPRSHLQTSISHSQVQTTHRFLQNKLSQFKEKMKFQENSINIKDSGTVSVLINEARQAKDVIETNLLKERLGPGELKNSVEEDTNVIGLAKQILLTYSVKLRIRVENKRSSEVLNLLKYLVPEICSFSPGLFKKLGLTKIMIIDSDKENPAKTDKDISFCVNQLDTVNKVHKRLYKLLLDHIISAKPDIFSEIETGAVGTKTEILEATFYALMKKKQYILQTQKMNELKELLIKCYPEEMSEEWFEKRKKERQGLRVQFDLSDHQLDSA